MSDPELVPPMNLALLLLLGVPFQAVEDAGPHLAGWRDVVFQDAIFGQGTIQARVYYPALVAGQGAAADPGAGPFRLVGFQHGWLGSPADYDDLCSHLASWGMVVASTGTETGLFPDTAQYARDTRSLLHWAEAESAAPSSWLAGMIESGTTWAVAGHSMGGGTLSLLIGIEPRIATIVGLQAADADAPGAANMGAFAGAAFWIAGSRDWVVRSRTVYDWFDRARSARRDLFWEVQGMGHTGCTDTPPGNEPLPGPEQHRLHRRLVAGLLRAELHGEEDLYRELVGQGFAGEPAVWRSRCASPPLWAVLDVGGVAIEHGLAGVHGSGAALAWSLVPASISTVYGVLGLSPSDLTVSFQGILPGAGTIAVSLPVQSSWSGRTLYLQGLALTPLGPGALSRTAPLPLN